MRINYLILCHFCIGCCFVISAVAHVAIVGGDRAEAGQFPYQVSLVVRGDENMCGGGILAAQFILTAAHCVVRYNGKFMKSRITIIAGTNYLDVTHGHAVIAEVMKVYVPRQYTERVDTSPDDIAVIKLREPLSLSNHKYMKKLRLPMDRNETYVGKTANIAGFGWDWINVQINKEYGGKLDRQLLFADADVLSCCQKAFYLDVHDEKQICARVRQHGLIKTRGVCNGDSGGPLVYDDTVVGILSLSPNGCSERENCAIYTRVSHYKNFIRDAIHDNYTPNILTHEHSHENS